MRFVPKWHPDHPRWKWRRWFAWRPVFVPRLGQSVWLEFVYRRYVPKFRPMDRDNARSFYLDVEKDMLGVLARDAERQEQEQVERSLGERMPRPLSITVPTSLPYPSALVQGMFDKKKESL